MQSRSLVIGLGIAVVIGAGVYGLTRPDPEPLPEPSAELPADHPLRRLLGVYELETVWFGPCDAPESVPVPESTRYFGFRVAMQQVVGKPCESVEGCRAMLDPEHSFRFSPTPKVSLSDGLPKELELSLPELLSAAFNFSIANGNTFSGASTAMSSFPGPDGASHCISVVANANALLADDRLVVSRLWSVSGPAPGTSCIEAELRCVQSVELTLRPVGS